MSDRRVYDCDRCGARDVGEAGRLYLVVGRVTCPAGGPSEDDIEILDVCQMCAAVLLCELAKERAIDGAKLAAAIRSHKKKATNP